MKNVNLYFVRFTKNHLNHKNYKSVISIILVVNTSGRNDQFIILFEEILYICNSTFLDVRTIFNKTY